MEQVRSKVEDNKTVDTASYETQFVKHTPVDFSLWDCYKTGVGSPAISCSLTKKPTGDEISGFRKLEQQQTILHEKAPAIIAYLTSVTPEQVIASCGQVTVIKDSDFVSFDAFLKAKDGPTPKVGTPGIMYKSIIDIAIVYSNVTFEWSTITVKNGEIDRVNGWYKTQSTADEAAEAVKDVPCIMDHIHNEITPTRPHQFTK